MTNNDTESLTKAMIAATDRRLAEIARDRERFANPIMPAQVSRPAPKARNRYRRRRTIR